MRMTPYSVYWNSPTYWTRGIYRYLKANGIRFANYPDSVAIHSIPLPYSLIDKEPLWLKRLMSILNAEGWSGEEKPDPFFTATLKSKCCNADVTRHAKFGADPHDDTVWYFCEDCGEETTPIESDKEEVD